MHRYTLDQLLHLPEGQAAEKHFDGTNWAVFRWLLAGFLAASAIASLVLAVEGHALRLAFAGSGVGVTGAYLLARRTRFFERRFRPLLLAYMLVQFALLEGWAADTELRIALAFFLLPALYLLFRLRVLEHLLLYLVTVGSGAWQYSVNAQDHGAPLVGALVAMSLPAAFFFSAAIATTRRRLRRFLDDFRRLATRERERARMRDELHDARRIQLAMLPTAEPHLSWAEVASSSLPASEVGGDYFDYFPLDDDRLAIVIGDVAGHGMGSGLVLAGMRSGLYLLRDELGEPLAVVGKLNRMLRESVRWRMFVTLLVAVLEPRERRLRVVSAGHPPLLHYRAADGEVHSVGGAGAPPLGTRLPVEFREITAPLEPGDSLLFFTDGLPEIADLSGATYGDARLRREFQRAATRRGRAAEVRDLLLGDVSRFKNDVTQTDDLTLVVARMTATEEDE